MRHSMGSAWIFSLCLTFIILFTAYLAITLNYARAFRVKNHIVTYIEEHEGYIHDYEDDIVSYLSSEGFNANGKCKNRIYAEGYEDDWFIESCINKDENGNCQVCIYKHGDECGARTSYRVVTFFKFDLPVVRYFSSFQVGGETRYFNDYASCDS